MLRKNFMKRLSKSATDLSGCKKKTHSTSPEEEERKDGPFTTPTHVSDDEDGSGGHPRPASAASTRSVPEFPASSSSKKDKPLSGTLSRKAKKLWNKGKQQQQQPSEVGIRNVGGQIHSAYRGHQGFLSLLKEKFRGSPSAATSTDPNITSTDPNSQEGTPEMVRKKIEAPDPQNSNEADISRTSTPEIVRIRNSEPNCGGEEKAKEKRDAQGLNGESKAPEVVRHGMPRVEDALLKDEAHHRPASGAEVVRYKVEEMAKDKKEENKTPQQIRQESLSSNAPSLEEATEKCHTLYHLHVCLRNGRELIARDSGGTSDPYVKFYWRNKQVYKSKTIDKDLNPVWDESFILAIDDRSLPLEIKVYDHDWAFRDDFMGEGSVPLSSLAPDKLTEHVITLKEDNNTEYLGQIVLGLRLVPKNVLEGENSCVGSLVKASGMTLTASVNSQIATSADAHDAHHVTKKRAAWSATVNVVLVEGRGLMAMDVEGTSDPYCKVRLGNDRYKTKVIYETLDPKWLEQFDLSLIEDQSQELEITVWDKDQRSKDDFMGRCSVDLSKLEHEVTHQLNVDLEEGTGQLFLLLTISGRANMEPPITDLDKYSEDQEVLENRVKGFQLRNTFNDLNAVGHLQIKIYSAKGLHAADLGGKSDPFVVLELDNTRLQTHTEYKTISPTWNRVLNMPVGDIHSVLHVSVYDEDRNHKYEFLGKTAFPLLRIESGRKRWYALRDKKLRVRAKGNNPQILLQFELHWNTIRAAVRTLNPREEKYMAITEKFKRQVFINNVMRIKAIIMEFVELGKFVESLLEWESPIKTLFAFIVYIVTCYYCEPFWFPIFLLLVFVRYYIVFSFINKTGHHRQVPHHDHDDTESLDLDGEEDLDEKDTGGDKSEEKMTFKERLQAVQDVTATVQNALGYLAHLAEGVKNTFNFSVPFLSWLAIIAMFAIGLVLYFINLRYLLIIWGINKFSKKLIRPNYVPNNELLDFLSRVPDDEELLDFREMRLLDESITHSPTKRPASSAGGHHNADGKDKKKKKS